MADAKSAQELVAAAKAGVENLDVEQVASELESGDPLVVDLREQAELDRTGTIPGAIHAPRGMLEFYADPSSPYHLEQLDPSRRTILHCASGGRSALAARTLSEMGYEDIAHLDGGIKAWTEAGKPVEGGSEG